MQVKKQQLELDMEQQTGSKQEKEYVKAVYYHPAYLNYAEYIMRNDGLEEAQAGNKNAGRDINNLRYADDTNLMAGNEDRIKTKHKESQTEDQRIKMQRKMLTLAKTL